MRAKRDVLEGVPDLVSADRVREVLDITSKTLTALCRTGALRSMRLPTGGFRYNAADLAKIAKRAAG